VFFFFLGFTGVALGLGRLLGERLGLGSLAGVVLVLLGLVMVDVWSLIGEIASLLPWPLRFFALMLLVGGFLFKYLAWTTGLGAALLEQFSPLPAGAYEGVRHGSAPPPPGAQSGRGGDQAWESESEPLEAEQPRPRSGDVEPGTEPR
ncbi:MAG: hypothetical protein MI919_38515, partial [Holophagales bacterium]|nr:hypothetical protein [Holophagales bacterium]